MGLTREIFTGQCYSTVLVLCQLYLSYFRCYEIFVVSMSTTWKGKKRLWGTSSDFTISTIFSFSGWTVEEENHGNLCFSVKCSDFMMQKKGYKLSFMEFSNSSSNFA